MKNNMDKEIVTPAYLDAAREKKAILDYILQNCIFAFDELCRVNKRLIAGLSPSSNADVNHLGAMNRMIQDYLIIRVAGLFDKTEYRTNGANDEVVSFEKIYRGDQKYKELKQEEVIKYIINQRDNFVAHTNKNHIENNFPATRKICDSNLKELLKDLADLLN